MAFRESMTEDKRDAGVGTEVGEPVPGEPAVDGDHHSLSRRSNDVQEGLWGGFHVAVHKDLAALVENADVHRAGMQVDAAGKWMLGGVEAQEVSSSLESDFPTPSIPPGYAGEGASSSITALKPTPSSLRYAALCSGFRARLTNLGHIAYARPIPNRRRT
jgi:hypothetical protein